ncbi:protein ALP1-like [Cimex lectularius]|uniref:DDE Tnp4 domain-containing protein n=1 Tax=Cimex lectularius TaxID=79782 RepID=A0A8I6SGS5_CIMLE|nr:protein ALP1-like [Cimex lectularius]
MFKTIAVSYRMGERTVSNIVSQVCNALWLRLQPIYMPTPSKEMWEHVSLDFERKWQFYNCVGAIDGKHICIRKPIHSGSSFHNYKQYFSVVLMASVDAHYRFTTIDVGSMGRFSDGNIFLNSRLGTMLHNESLELPDPKSLPGQNEITPYVFVGDEAFPLMPNLMRPYPRLKVTNNSQNKVFNYRLSRARQTVECAFGILSVRFRVYKRPFECKLETIENIVKATTVLHNYLRTNAVQSNSIDVDDELMISNNNSILVPLQNNRIRSSRQAFLIREKFKMCFNSAQGSVEWQNRAVQRGHY